MRNFVLLFSKSYQELDSVLQKRLVRGSLPESSPAIMVVCCSAELIFLSSCFSSDSLGNLSDSKLEDDLQRVSWEACVNLD